MPISNELIERLERELREAESAIARDPESWQARLRLNQIQASIGLLRQHQPR